MCDDYSAVVLAKMGREEYDLIRLHDAPNSDDHIKYECDLKLAQLSVMRCEMALKNVYNEECVTPAKLRYLRDDIQYAHEHLRQLQLTPV